MKKMLSTVVIVMVSMILLFTNPQTNQYRSWCKDKVLEQDSGYIEKLVINKLSDIIVNQFTTTKNYFFFTIYDTKIGKEEVKTVGLLNNFIPLKNTFVSRQ